MSSNSDSYKNYFKNHQNNDDKDLLDEIDISKIVLVVKKSLIWIFLFFSLGITTSILYLRYTPKTYESYSTIKVKQENEAQEMNLINAGRGRGNTGDDLQGEIELIRSKIVYDKIIENLNLWISYYAEGRVLDDEKFPSDFFTISNYNLLNQSLLNSNIYIEVLSKNEFLVSYIINEILYEQNFKIGQTVKTNHIEFNINLETPENHIGRKLYFIINSKPKLYSYLSSNLSAIPNDRSETININFKDNNKAKAQAIDGQADSLYLKLTLEEKQKKSEQSIAYIERQLEKTGGELSNYELQWEEFSKENTTSNIDQDHVYYLSQMRQTQMNINNSKYYLETINKVLLDLEKDSVTNTIPLISYIEDARLTSLSEELITIDNKIKSLLRSRSEDDIVIKMKLKTYNETKDKVINVLKDLETSENQIIQDLNKELAKLKAKVNSLPRQATIQSQIDRKFSLYEKFYGMLQEKKLEYEIQKAGIVQEFRILSPASFPSEAISPNRKMIYIYGIVVALTFSLLLLIIRYLLQNTLISQQDFQRLTTVPVLGVVPKHKKKMEVSQLVVHHNPKASISEAFRSLRTNLEFLSSTDGKKIFSVTSTIGGEGKTFVSTNLSAIIALSGKKVVLLDLDMRKPKVHLAFGMENNEGMSTILIGKSKIENCVQHTEVEGLDFISAGPIPPNPSELILRKSFDDTLNNLHKIYDIIIIDTPPTGLVTDGVLIMKKVDVPIYVARSEYTKKGFEKNLNALHSQKEFSKLAVIINGMSKTGSYGYGYGYGYGSYYEEEEEPTFFSKIFNRS